MSNRRIPSLVQYCQRVAIQNVDSISAFGDELRFELIRPILESCAPETLLRLEETSPHLPFHTSGIWRDMCSRSYPLVVAQYSEECDGPVSWRQEFFDLHTAEARRLEALGKRLRANRHVAEVAKKQREIQITTQSPPAKRARTERGYSKEQPKTLFQKTRLEASRIQKSIYTGFTAPRTTQGTKDYRVGHNTQSAKMTLPVCTKVSDRVTVNTVYLRDDSATSSSGLSSSASSPPASVKSSQIYRRPPHAKLPVVARPTPPKPAARHGKKKDPTAGLFMPKHRAHSQLPTPDVGGTVSR